MDGLTYSEADKQLQRELYQSIQNKDLYPFDEYSFRNRSIHHSVIEKQSVEDIFRLLEENSTFSFNAEHIDWQDIDGETKQLTINRASKTDMWPMGTNYWVRDNAFIAQRLLNLDYTTELYPQEWYSLVKRLLLSCLTIISSITQLSRFEKIIDGTNSHQLPEHWPHIFLSIDSNLNAAETEPWMHKQDAWQIICYVTLEALEKGHITEADLSEKHHQLLNLICPFLSKIEFTSNNNAGSWEEIDAIRSSVIIWETALLDKVKKSNTFFHPDAENLFQQGISAICNMLPDESPSYQKEDPRRRAADASLLYLFLSDLYLLLPKEKQDSIITKTLTAVEFLCESHGMKRYQNDSYQGLSYYTNSVSTKLTALYDSPSGDSSDIDQFIQRGKIVPSGHEAQWSHFIWQLSSVYGKLATHFSENSSYKEKQTHFFLKGLSLITGDNEISITQSHENTMELISLSPFQVPECYNSETYNKTIFHYPSHHTPLYWASAECLHAFDQMVRRENKLNPSIWKK